MSCEFCGVSEGQRHVRSCIMLRAAEGKAAQLKLEAEEKAVGVLEGDYFRVNCPHCGGDCTAFREGRVYFRDTESPNPGSETGKRIAFSRTAFKIDEHVAAAPGRRSGIRLVCDCENCPKLFTVEITNHKGNLLITTDPDIYGA